MLTVDMTASEDDQRAMRNGAANAPATIGTELTVRRGVVGGASFQWASTVDCEMDIMEIKANPDLGVGEVRAQASVSCPVSLTYTGPDSAFVDGALKQIEPASMEIASLSFDVIF